MKAYSAICLGLLLVCSSFLGMAQPADSNKSNKPAATYPDRPVRLIVPYSTGGGTDIVARVVAQKLTELWGRAVVVDNRPGAGDTLGTALAVQAPADGYTLVMSSISLAFDPAIYEHLPYDPVRDLAPVALVASQPNMLVVNPALGVTSIAQLIALAKARPGAINYASGGVGSGPHLATELFDQMAGIKLTHVPYKGTGPALTDLLGGQVELMICVTASSAPLVKAGKLRALAVTGARRSSLEPDLPTIAEAGVPGYEFNTWYGIEAPAGTPRPIIDRINADVVRAMQSPDVRTRLVAQGLEPLGSTPEEFRALIASEVAKWTQVARTIGIR
jgi:tripartite-type tricarboxylate transporter receptor subunit TctC